MGPDGSSPGKRLRKLIFWEFKRVTWQYDVVVALILAFIFLTPREVFRDQPRPRSVVLLSGHNGSAQFWIEPDLMTGIEETAWTSKANELVNDRPGKQHRVTRVEPIYDAEREVRGYMAYATQP